MKCMINQMQNSKIYQQQNPVFHMKNHKQKNTSSKKPVILPVQDQNTPNYSSNIKQFSGHTKVSTNWTLHSSTPGHAQNEKKAKNKKLGVSSSKQNPLDIKKGQSNSKSKRKCKVLEIPLNLENPPNWETQQNYHQYCVVDQKFVPITSKNEQKLFEDFLSQTASTTYFQDQSKNTVKNKGFQLQKPRLRKRTSSISKEREQELKQKDVQKQDKAISSMQYVKAYMTVQVQAATECCQIGMQYSERKQVIQQKTVQANQKEAKIAQKMEENKLSREQSLSDLLFKLQFNHLVDDNSFKTLTTKEKEHFTQLLESLMAKLTPKQKQANGAKKIKSKSFGQINKNQAAPQSQEQSSQEKTQKQGASSATINFQRLQLMITHREYLQKNMIENEHEANHLNVDTSLLSILNFLGHLCCLIELQYTEEFIFMIQKLYGLNFKQKYRRITRDLPLYHQKKFRVIDQAIFVDFVNQADVSTYNNNEITHFKAIFDAFNEHLEEYRPYYLGNGEQFPWAFRLFTTISEYSIDQDSLHIIFRQAKQKILEWAQNLCGIIVDYEQPLPPRNPLELKYQQKEDILINSWLKEQNFEKDQIQLYSTQSLHDCSEQIFNELIQQLAKEAAFRWV